MGQAVGGSVGAALEERYFLQKVKLGQGSFGTVWRAVDRQDDRTVAIKQLEKASLPRRGVTRADIEREISMMKACVHENITQLFNTYEDEKNIYLALEYCDGGDFGDKVKEKGMGAQEPEVAEWIRQMCSAINAMHMKGICHRDIKPDNFMVQEVTPQSPGKLKLSDFGLAVFLPKGKLLTEKCGTPAFMSPEQHHLPRKSAGYAFPADMWACGVSMYMVMFGGKHPFINVNGGLDDGLLLSGELDFRDSSSSNVMGGFFNFGGLGASLRFSEEARSLCSRLVEPDDKKRISAEETLRIRWLTVLRQQERPPAGPRSSPSGSRSPPPEEDGRGAPQTAMPESRKPELNGGPGLQARPRADSIPREAAARARTPVPETSQAIEERRRLEMQNRQLQAELDARRVKEEELATEQNRLAEQAALFERRRSEELAKHRREIEEMKKNKEQLEAEKEELRVQATQAAAHSSRAAQATQAPRGDPTKGGSYMPSITRKLNSQGTGLDKMASKSGGKLLQRGVKCRYESGTYGWVEGVVQGFNEDDCTYNLNIRQHASLDKIAPLSEVKACEAWPPETLVHYHSTSIQEWLPGKIISFNESDGTYNLDLRDHADVDRIRARSEARTSRPGDEAAGGSGFDPPRRLNRGMTKQLETSDPAATDVGDHPALGPAGKRGAMDSSSSREGGVSGAKKVYRVNELEADPEATGLGPPLPPGRAPVPRYVQKDDFCLIERHGLVLIDQDYKGGSYSVKVSERHRIKVVAEEMRAPADARHAWPAGTKVSYLSSSVGSWIDANVVRFNPPSQTYDLDVRQEAAPDKVRPR